MTLLDVVDLSVSFLSHRAFSRKSSVVDAVRGISFSIETGRHFGLVGESGSGKSVTCLALSRLIEEIPGARVSGSVMFGGNEVMTMGADELQRLRGGGIAYVFQDPRGQLSEVMCVGELVAETVLIHDRVSPAEAKTRAKELLLSVGLCDIGRVYHAYPAELSGGMCQRIAIALALSCRPRLLIADEPTTNLDVLRQEAVIELIEGMCERYGTTVLMVSHDLGVVRRFCRDLAVLEDGIVVETGVADEVIDHPSQPYTKTLRDSVICIEPSGSAVDGTGDNEVFDEGRQNGE